MSLLLLALLAQQRTAASYVKTARKNKGWRWKLHMTVSTSCLQLRTSDERVKAELPLSADNQQLQSCFLDELTGLSSLKKFFLLLVTSLDLNQSGSAAARAFTISSFSFSAALFFMCFSASSSFHTVNHPPCRACDSLRAAVLLYSLTLLSLSVRSLTPPTQTCI